MYDDFWMAEQGFVRCAPQGDLRDVILHRYEADEVVSTGPDDTLLTAFKRMRTADVSQLPVVDLSGHVVGILDSRMCSSKSTRTRRISPHQYGRR